MIRGHRLVLAGLLPAVHATFVSFAIAQETRQDPPSAQAEDLFDQGSKLLQQGRFDEACPKLENAQRLVAGVGVTLYLGECYEEAGRLVEAWQQFDQAAKLAAHKNDSRERIARQRAERLWPSLPKIRVTATWADAAPDLKLFDDGVSMDRSTWGIEHPVVPRVHQIRAVASDREPWEVSISIPDTPGTLTVEVPPLRPISRASTAAPSEASRAAAAVGTAALPAMPGPRDAVHPSHAAQRATSFALIGVGVATIGVASAFGLQAKGKMDESNAGDCPNNLCYAQGRQLRVDALNDAAISTVGFFGGAMCLLGGSLLYFDIPLGAHKIAVSPRPLQGGTGLSLQGRW